MALSDVCVIGNALLLSRIKLITDRVRLLARRERNNRSTVKCVCRLKWKKRVFVIVWVSSGAASPRALYCLQSSR